MASEQGYTIASRERDVVVGIVMAGWWGARETDMLIDITREKKRKKERKREKAKGREKRESVCVIE